MYDRLYLHCSCHPVQCSSHVVHSKYTEYMLNRLLNSGNRVVVKQTHSAIQAGTTVILCLSQALITLQQSEVMLTRPVI